MQSICSGKKKIVASAASCERTLIITKYLSNCSRSTMGVENVLIEQHYLLPFTSHHS